MNIAVQFFFRHRFWQSSEVSWPRGVMVSTLDSESSDRGSNPREALSFLCISPISPRAIFGSDHGALCWGGGCLDRALALCPWVLGFLCSAVCLCGSAVSQGLVEQAGVWASLGGAWGGGGVGEGSAPPSPPWGGVSEQLAAFLRLSPSATKGRQPWRAPTPRGRAARRPKKRKIFCEFRRNSFY